MIAKLDRTILDLDAAIKLNPGFVLALFNRGVAYHAKREPARAIADYDQAIKLNPRDAVAYYSRGLAHKDRRQMPGAGPAQHPANRIV